MALKDKIRWNKKYNETPELLENRKVSKQLNFILKNIKNIKSKKVLDVACGTGRNSIFCAQQGCDVTAVDISEVALKSLEKRAYENITTYLTDLDTYVPRSKYYDLIIMSNYLDRELINKLAQSLDKDGMFFIETYMAHPSNTKKSSNSNYLLQKEELKTFFDDSYEILEYKEFDNEPTELYKMRKQFILVKKI